MPDARLDDVSGAEIALDRLRLGRRLDDDESAAALCGLAGRGQLRSSLRSTLGGHPGSVDDAARGAVAAECDGTTRPRVKRQKPATATRTVTRLPPFLPPGPSRSAGRAEARACGFSGVVAVIAAVAPRRPGAGPRRGRGSDEREAPHAEGEENYAEKCRECGGGDGAHTVQHRRAVDGARPGPDEQRGAEQREGRAGEDRWTLSMSVPLDPVVPAPSRRPVERLDQGEAATPGASPTRTPGEQHAPTGVPGPSHDVGVVGRGAHRPRAAGAVTDVPQERRTVRIRPRRGRGIGPHRESRTTCGAGQALRSARGAPSGIRGPGRRWSTVSVKALMRRVSRHGRARPIRSGVRWR